MVFCQEKPPQIIGVAGELARIPEWIGMFHAIQTHSLAQPREVETYLTIVIVVFCILCLWTSPNNALALLGASRTQP